MLTKTPLLQSILTCQKGMPTKPWKIRTLRPGLAEVACQNWQIWVCKRVGHPPSPKQCRQHKFLHCKRPGWHWCEWNWYNGIDTRPLQCMHNTLGRQSCEWNCATGIDTRPLQYSYASPWVGMLNWVQPATNELVHHSTHTIDAFIELWIAQWVGMLWGLEPVVEIWQTNRTNLRNWLAWPGSLLLRWAAWPY